MKMTDSQIINADQRGELYERGERNNSGDNILASNDFRRNKYP